MFNGLLGILKQGFVLAAEVAADSGGTARAGASGGKGLLSKIDAAEVVSTVAYSLVGFVLFVIAFLVMEKLTPFSIRKEIEEDQNVALAVIMAGVTIGMAIIVSAAIR